MRFSADSPQRRVRGARGDGLFLAAGVASAADAIPLRDLLCQRRTSVLRGLSPSGRHLALTVPATWVGWSSRSWRSAPSAHRWWSPSSTRVDIASFDWVNDERLVYSILDLQCRGLRPGVRTRGCSRCKRDGSEARQLVQTSRIWRRGAASATEAGPVPRLDQGAPGTEAMTSSSANTSSAVPASLIGIIPKRLDVTTGLLAKPRPRRADQRVRVGVRCQGRAPCPENRDPGRGRGVLARGRTDSWRSLLKSPNLSSGPGSPKRSTARGSSMWLARRAPTRRRS